MAGLVLAGTPASAQESAPVPESEREALSTGQSLLRRKQYRAVIDLIKPFQPQSSPSATARDLTELLAAA